MFPPSQPEWKVFLLLLQHGFTDLNEMSLIRILLKPSMKLTLVHRKERLHEAINTCLFISEKKNLLQKVVSVVTQVLNQNDRSQQLCFVSDSFFIVCNSHRERGGRSGTVSEMSTFLRHSCLHSRKFFGSIKVSRWQFLLSIITTVSCLKAQCPMFTISQSETKKQHFIWRRIYCFVLCHFIQLLLRYYATTQVKTQD